MFAIVLLNDHSSLDTSSLEFFYSEGASFTFGNVVPTLCALSSVLLFTTIAIYPPCRTMRRSALWLMIVSFYALVVNLLCLPTYWDSNYTLMADIDDFFYISNVVMALVAFVAYISFAGKLKRFMLYVVAFFLCVGTLVGELCFLLIVYIPDISPSLYEDLILSENYMTLFYATDFAAVATLLFKLIFYFALPSAVRHIVAPQLATTAGAAESGDTATHTTSAEQQAFPEMPETPKFPPQHENKE